MIFQQSRTWSHAVISPLTDDIMPNVFDFNLDVWPDHPNWRLKVEAKHEDESIQQLIAARKACYLLHVECRRTHFRTAFKSAEKSFEVSISGDQLFGLVEASFLVIAIHDLDAYRHEGQHKDYHNTTFQISIGEPLAVAISKNFEAPLEADPILKLSSIIDIRKGGEEVHYMKVNCHGERIILELPVHEFEGYRSLRADPNLRGLLASTVIFPGLLQSLHYLHDLESTELADFNANHRWSRRVLSRLDAMGINISGGDEGGAICMQAVQQLLRGPLRRSMDDLATLFR
jgi:hypothetical protein